MKTTNSSSVRHKGWQELVRQHEQSDLSVSVFCRDRGISEPSFYSWRKRLAGDQPVRFALVEAGASVVNQHAPVELMLASGDRLRISPGADAGTLRTVLSVLRERV